MGNLLNKVCCLEEDENYSKHVVAHMKYQTNLTDYSSTNLHMETPSSEILLSSESNPTDHYPNYNNTASSSLNSFPIGVSTLIRQTHGNPSDNYINLHNIGKGSFGSVVKVMHKKTGLIRSMKIIPKDNLKEGFTVDEIQREIKILKSLDHPHIIKLYEFYTDDDYYYLINEFCSEGDLSEKLITSKYFEEPVVKQLMKQILIAVLYLHSKKIIHGDLKLENVLIDSIQTHNRSSSNSKTLHSCSFDIKLIDFGCSKIFTHYKRQFDDTIGTTIYCAPEVLKNNYDEKCDVWSCGVIMFILLSGELPFYGNSERETTTNILNGKFTFDSKRFNKVSEAAKDLISKCLTYNKVKRITIKEALLHEFFREDDNNNNMCSLLNVNVNVCNEHVVTVLNVFKQLKGRSTFYQAVLTFLSHNYADKREIQVLKKVFFSIDCDMDGRISKEELQCAYDKWNVSVDQEEVDSIFENVDLDKNGYIEYEEFIRAALANTEELFCDINLKAAFDVFDLDKNGIITLKELSEVLGVETNEDNAEMLRRSVFKEGIEGVTFEHFKEIMLLK